jgi:hypothetical protein
VNQVLTFVRYMLRHLRQEFQRIEHLKIARLAFPEPAASAWAELREALLMTSQNLENCGLAVAINIGQAKNIHPRNKQDMGKRLALATCKTACKLESVYFSINSAIARAFSPAQA